MVEQVGGEEEREEIEKDCRDRMTDRKKLPRANGGSRGFSWVAIGYNLQSHLCPSREASETDAEDCISRDIAPSERLDQMSQSVSREKEVPTGACVL